jgi:radical SAM-linked protein
MNVFMSALLRSKLPAAYSEGFNPHLKVSFATALGVGVTSDCEYVDFELSQNIKSNEVMTRLNSHLPKGAEIVRIRKINVKVPALTAAIDFSRYEILIDADFEETLNAVKIFNAAKEIHFTRVTPKHTREIEIKKYIAEAVEVSKVDGETLITFGVKIFLEGTIKPSEILQVLHEKFNLNVEVTAAKINRTALLSGGKNLLEVI